MTKILVIEDHAMLRNEIVEMLQLTNYTVCDAPDGQTGLDLAQSEHPDLILCDVMMNNIDGFEVLRRLRGNPETAALPLIFLTARSDRDSMRQGMGLGADDYVTKPFSADELLGAIQTRLSRHNDIKRQAESQIDEAKQRLMRMVTHELRTPLVSINMVLEIISRQMSFLTPQQLQEMLDTLGSGSKRLNRVVEQIVLATQLQTGILSTEAIGESGVAMPLWEIIVASIALGRRFAYKNPNVNVELIERDKSALVLCNLPALKHALAELITNALSFSPDGRSISISQWKSQGMVWISITDQGPGIAPDELQRALENFQQINRDHQEQQGLGLGLGLAHHLIATHGGSLELKSVPGKGTQAIVALPLMSSALDD